MSGFVKYFDADRNTVTVVTDAPEGAAHAEDLLGAHVVRISAKSVLRRAVFTAGESRVLHLIKSAWNRLLNITGAADDRAWVRKAVSKLNEIHKVTPVDVIISSYGPSGPHLAAIGFAKRHVEVKWVADMRDEMSLNPHLDHRSRRRLAMVEKQVDRHAEIGRAHV